MTQQRDIGGMPVKPAMRCGWSRVTALIDPIGCVGLGSDIKQIQLPIGRQSGVLEREKMACGDIWKSEIRSSSSMAANALPAAKRSGSSSPSIISTMMGGKKGNPLATIEKVALASISISCATAFVMTSKSSASIAISANEETAESSSRIVVSREGATTIPKGSRGKRPEAPGFAKANDDIVWSAWKHAAARKGGAESRDFGMNTRSFFNQVCGYTAQSDVKYTGLNATVAPSSDRKVNAGGVAQDENLTSSDTFTLDLIDQAVETAKVGSNMVRPIRIGGQPKYVMYLHPYQVTSMRTNSSTGQWLDIQKAAMMGGQVTNSPIYSGALGEYNGVVLRSSQDVTQGVNSSSGVAISTVRRAVLLGAQSAIIAFGQANYGPTKFRWNEELIGSSVAGKLANDNFVNSGEALAA